MPPAATPRRASRLDGTTGPVTGRGSRSDTRSSSSVAARARGKHRRSKPHPWRDARGDGDRSTRSPEHVGHDSSRDADDPVIELRILVARAAASYVVRLHENHARLIHGVRGSGDIDEGSRGVIRVAEGVGRASGRSEDARHLPAIDDGSDRVTDTAVGVIVREVPHKVRRASGG